LLCFGPKNILYEDQDICLVLQDMYGAIAIRLKKPSP
jgi:hypothetical protein